MKRVKKSERQKEILEAFFRTNQKPNKSQTSSLAVKSGLSYNEVRNWFKNARIRKCQPPVVHNCNMPLATSLDMSMNSGVVGDQVTSIVDDGITFMDKLPEAFKANPPLAPPSGSGLSMDKKCDKIQHFIETLNLFPAHAATRTTMLCNFITDHTSVADKMVIHQRLLGYAVEEPSNRLLRCRDVWSVLEHMFGIKQQDLSSSSSCDAEEADMFPCLKELFKDHTDYLATVKWLFQQNIETDTTQFLHYCQSYHSHNSNPTDSCHGGQSVPHMMSHSATPITPSTDLLITVPTDDNFYSKPTTCDSSGTEPFNVDSLLVPMSEQYTNT